MYGSKPAGLSTMLTGGSFFTWRMTMEFTKPFLTYDEQADLLISRGMVADRDALVEHLQDVGYYRLSGYWRIFRNDDDTLREGTTFERVWDLYVFDRQFRLVVLDAIERVEIYFRTQLSHMLARDTGAFGYLDNSGLPRLGARRYEQFMSRAENAFSRSREPFAVHFRERYGDSHSMPPYWMFVNVIDFGIMLSMYKGASVDIRNELAAKVGVSARVLESWLVSLNTTRNICAHHGRLWNRIAGTRPTIPNERSDPRWHDPYEVEGRRVFATLTILSYLLSYVAPDTSWRERLFALLDSRSEYDLKQMGFSEGWQSCPFWEPWALKSGGDAGPEGLEGNRGRPGPIDCFLTGAGE